MPFSYATATSGPSAGGIGWLNFGNQTINPGQTLTALTGTLNDGTIVTFNLSLSLVSGTGRPFVATQPPTFPGAQFGVSGYTGIIGNVALYGDPQPLPGTSLFTVSNIVVTNPDLSPVPNYTVVIADAERMNLSEQWIWNTNGDDWNLLATLGPNPPVLNGIGTQTVTIDANGATGVSAAYVATTMSPTQLLITSVSDIASRQAFAIGFAVTRVRLQKNIAGRIDPLDQFQMDIAGTPAATVTTSGATGGIQTPQANVFASPSNPYVISEAMAPGSVSPLSAYTQMVSAANATPAGSVPPTGNLPVTFTPALGDDVTYTILNVAPEAFVKTVDKAFTDIGEVLTYTIEVENPNNFVLNNVLVTDATPSGTTFVPGSVTGATGTPPTLTIPSIPAGGNATVTFQVQVGNAVPSPNPILNSATVNYTYTVDPADPNGASGSRSSNTVQTQANMALVTTTKAVSDAYAELGQTLTYTLTIRNTGNVAADAVTITDAVPAGTDFVPGSVTGAIGIPPTLTLAAPLAPGDTATVTFQVKIGDTFPVPNPIPNSAVTAFTYTVDPEEPDGASGTAPSNTVTTQVNDANINTVKTVDKTFSDVGEVLTYTLVLSNSGNVPATNVVITDAVPLGTTFINGSLIGATGTPPTLTLPAPIPAGGSATVSYQVLVGDSIPNPNPIPNTAEVDFTFTLDPAEPDGETGTDTSNTVNTQVNSAIVTTTKAADKAFANVGDTITYTITVANSGNTTANNVVLTDSLPAGTSFVAGSVTGATGTPPTLTLLSPVPAGGSVVVTYQVLVGAAIPNPNPVENSASAAFTYTVDTTDPNGASGTSYSNTVETQVNTAKLVISKSVDKEISYIGDIVTYQISVKNIGNTAANQVVLTDLLPTNVSLVPASLVVSVPYSGTLAGGLSLTGPIAAGQTVTISFAVKVDAMPIPNPIANRMTATYAYTVDPAAPDAVTADATSNVVTTLVFRYNFSQQISDLIESIALEQAALAAIAQAEGAKIQRMAAMPGVTTQQLLCLNKSVTDMTDSLVMLEAVLKQKLSIVECQIDGTGC